MSRNGTLLFQDPFLESSTLPMVNTTRGRPDQSLEGTNGNWIDFGNIKSLRGGIRCTDYNKDHSISICKNRLISKSLSFR